MNKPKYSDRNGNEIDASAALDHRGALRDGCTLRVPFQARDSLSTTQLAVRDATAARDARARAYELYDREIEQMYKGGMMRDTDPTWSQTNPRGRSSEATGEGERGTPRDQQPGDLCTIDGRPGQLKTIGGELRYVPDKADSIGFTDHSGNPWSASRPGFRIKVGDSRKAQHDAIADYNKEISNRWKCGDRQSVCSSCFGTGLDPTDGTFCINCAGEGVTDDAYESSPDEAAANTAADRAPDIRHRSLDEMMKSHRERMTSLYDAYDKSISEQWRHR